MALALLLAAGTGAETPPAASGPLDLRFAMTYAGLPVASAELRIEPGGAETRSELVIEEEGIAALLGRSITRMTAISRGGAEPAPKRFEARYEKPDRTREAAVLWNGQGQIVKAVELKAGRERPSEVPEAEQIGTMDPLTAVLRLRDWLAQPTTTLGAETRLPVFDGRKRFDMEARRIPDSEAQGAAQPRLEVRLVPLFGFDRSDHYVSWADQPPRWFEVIVSGDGRFAPLSVGEGGRPVLVATHDCSGQAGCQPLRQP